MKIEVQQASLGDKLILRNLLELYEYDSTEFEPRDVDAHGLYGYRWLDHYWSESGRYPFLVRVDGKPAGFALVRTLDDDPYSMAEFFILKRYRRQGVGQVVAQQIFDMFPGRWNVAQVENNHPAQAFWRKVIFAYTHGNFQETWSNNTAWKAPIQTFSTRANALGEE